jgi:hypothetical protein
MKASDRIRTLRNSAERLEKQGSARAAAWYRKEADKAEKEAEAAREPRRWER